MRLRVPKNVWEVSRIVDILGPEAVNPEELRRAYEWCKGIRFSHRACDSIRRAVERLEEKSRPPSKPEETPFMKVVGEAIEGTRDIAEALVDAADLSGVAVYVSPDLKTYARVYHDRYHNAYDIRVLHARDHTVTEERFIVSSREQAIEDLASALARDEILEKLYERLPEWKSAMQPFLEEERELEHLMERLGVERPQLPQPPSGAKIVEVM